jgi:hypothetical protein
MNREQLWMLFVDEHNRLDGRGGGMSDDAIYDRVIQVMRNSAAEGRSWQRACKTDQPVMLRIRGVNRGYLSVAEACIVIRDLTKQVRDAA